MARDFDILISGGMVLDGSGAAPRRVDVGLRGDVIVAVGALGDAQAGLRIAASGKVVSPGFIDVHSHSDAYLLIEPSAPSKITQGITTEVVGNCGASAAPKVGAYPMPSDWRGLAYPGTWSTVAEYRALLERVKPGPNVVLLVGHNALRVGVAGYENRSLSSDELARMVRLLEQGLDEGARGLSTGLIYAPGLFAPSGELVTLVRAVGRRGGIYTSHMRSEGERLLEAIQETLNLGREGNARVEISHLKTSGRGNWRLLDEALALIRAARDAGQPVAADRYPYTSSSTDLDVVFPAWAQEGGAAALLGRLRDPAERARLREALHEVRTEESWGSVVVGSTTHPDLERFRGLSMTRVAEVLGVDPVEAVLQLVDQDEARTGAFFFGMNEENLMRILAEPYVMVGTDASLRSPTGVLSRDFPHPRAYGSFPRFLRMALDGKSVSLPEAIRKITSLPAAHFCLAGRGLVGVGMKADLVVLDPGRLHDRADYAAPHRFSEGVDHVIVNGVLTLHDGQFTGRRGGRVL